MQKFKSTTNNAFIPGYWMGRWIQTELQNESVMYTTNLGSQVLFSIANTLEFSVEFIATLPATMIPQTIVVSIDEHPRTIMLNQLKFNFKLTDSGSHNVRITFVGNTDQDQVWDGMQGLAIKNITSSGKITAIRPIHSDITFIGDSITAGCWVRSKALPSMGYGADINYAAHCAKLLNRGDIRIAYSAASIIRGGTGGVPVASEFLTHLNATTTFINDAATDVIINLGTNDKKYDEAVFEVHFKLFLQQVLTLFLQSTIWVMIPFDQSFATIITQVVQQYPSVQLIPTKDWEIATVDDVHPNATGSIVAGTNLAAILKQKNRR